jgi:hypothetical protein
VVGRAQHLAVELCFVDGLNLATTVGADEIGAELIAEPDRVADELD